MGLKSDLDPVSSSSDGTDIEQDSNMSNRNGAARPEEASNPNQNPLSFPETPTPPSRQQSSINPVQLPSQSPFLDQLERQTHAQPSTPTRRRNQTSNVATNTNANNFFGLGLGGPSSISNLNLESSASRSRAQLSSPSKASGMNVDMGDFRLDSIHELEREPAGSISRSSKNSHNKDQDDADSIRPPSFAESQFATIVRRQRKRRIFSPTEALIEGGGMMSSEGLRHREREREASNSDSVTGTPRLGIRRQMKASGRSTSIMNPNTVEEESSGRNRENDSGPTTLGREEFAGWGSMSMLELTSEELKAAEEKIESRTKPILGQWRAAAIAGNAVTGSIFYLLPAVITASSVYSPISILIACLLLYPFRPVLIELSSALSIANAGNYTYLLNVTVSKTLALFGASLTLLDAISTGAVSAATAASYLSAETTALSYTLITIILLLGLCSVCLVGLKDSSTLALSMVSLHMLTMVILIIGGAIAWGKNGNDQIRTNWNLAREASKLARDPSNNPEGVSENVRAISTLLGSKSIARSIFDGVCVAFVGLTGFETTPSYVRSVKPGKFGLALRNLHLAILFTEAPIMLMVLANLPLETLLGIGGTGASANVLALLGTVASGQWLKILVIVDAAVVLCGGIMTGVIASAGVVEALSSDLVVPKFLSRVLPTGASHFSILLFLILTLILCSTSSFSLSTLSSVFSVTFLCVMTLFSVALMILKYNRSSIPRSINSSLLIVLSAFLVGSIALIGNIVLSPKMLVQFLLYWLTFSVLLLVLDNKIRLVQIFLWLVDRINFKSNQNWLSRKFGLVGLNKKMMRWIRRERRPPVTYFTKTDELSHLISALVYVKANEVTSRVILVHCFTSVDQIHSELESNMQLTDESFPTITVDLVFVQAAFTPVVVEALSTKLKVPLTRCFLSCPRKGSKVGNIGLENYGGVRVIQDSF